VGEGFVGLQDQRVGQVPKAGDDIESWIVRWTGARVLGCFPDLVDVVVEGPSRRQLLCQLVGSHPGKRCPIVLCEGINQIQGCELQPVHIWLVVIDMGICHGHSMPCADALKLACVGR
jgi:hypothetical protein